MSLPLSEPTNPSKIPLAVNPSGSPPNFNNPPSLSRSIFWVGLVLCIASVFFVAIRLITNSRNQRKLRLADYLCVFAFVSLTSYYALIASLRNTARHTWDLPISIITESYLKKAAAENFIIGPTLWSSKAAILALYLQLFGNKRWLRWSSYLALIITFLLYWVNIPMTGVYCLPRNGAPWNANILLSCSKLAIMGPIHGATGVGADLFIFCLPIPIIYNLHLPLRKKIGLAAVFLMAIFTLIASCISLYYRVKTYTGSDPVWNGCIITMTTFAEGYLTIMVGCTPAISSFWINSVAKSAFYSKLSRFGSSLMSLRASHSKDSKVSKGISSTASKGQQRPPGSTTKLSENRGYYELHDGAYSRPATKIHSAGMEPFGQEGVITKSTSIDQMSES